MRSFALIALVIAASCARRPIDKPALTGLVLHNYPLLMKDFAIESFPPSGLAPMSLLILGKDEVPVAFCNTAMGRCWLLSKEAK